MKIVPATLREANAYFALKHRHHKRPVRGLRFAIALIDESEGVHGVALVGRTKARAYKIGDVAEICRVCTDGTPQACSRLYGRACAIAKLMGYERIITYTLASESGASLRAAGFAPAAEVAGREWGCKTRPREKTENPVAKIRWERLL